MTDSVKYNYLSMSYTSSSVGGTVWDYTIPLTASGPGTFILEVSNSFGSSSRSIERVSRPILTNITPSLVTTAGGSGLAINGNLFYTGSGNLAVKLGSTTLSGFTVTLTQITNVTIPPTSVGTYDITVINKATGSAVLAGAVTVVPIPTITSITGTANSTNGGTIAVTGTNFLTTAGYTTLTVGGNAATVGSITATTIGATIPPHAAGKVDVIVTNRGIISATSASGFEYALAAPPTLTSVTPTLLSTTGGVIRLTGSNFLGGTGGVFETVYLDSTISCSLVAPSGSTYMTATLPAHAAGLGNVSISNIFGTTATSQVEFVSIPTITSVTVVGNPSWIPNTQMPYQAGGFLDVTGTNFYTTPGDSVFKVESTTYSPATLTATTARLSLPAGLSQAAKSVYVVNKSTTNATASNAFTVVSASGPVISNVVPTQVSAGTSNTFTVYSSYLAGNDVVRYDNVVQTVTSGSGQLQFTVNAGVSGNHNIYLSNSFGPGNVSTIEAVAVPAVTSLSINYGSTTGSSFTINGSGFIDNANTIVTMTNCTLSSVNVVGTGTINCTYSTGTAGTQTITIRNKNFVQTTTTFSVIPQPAVSLHYTTYPSYAYLPDTNKLWANINAIYPQYIYVSMTGSWSGLKFNGSTVTLIPYTGNIYYFVAPSLAAGTYTGYAFNTVGSNSINSTTFSVVYETGLAPVIGDWAGLNSSTAAYNGGIGSVTLNSTPVIGAYVTQGVGPYRWTITPTGYDSWSRSASTPTLQSYTGSYGMTVGETVSVGWNTNVTHTGGYQMAMISADDRTSSARTYNYQLQWVGPVSAPLNMGFDPSNTPSYIGVTSYAYVYTNWTTVFGIDGIPPYSTSRWTYDSGDTNILCDDRDSATTRWKYLPNGVMTITSAVWRVTITDSEDNELTGYVNVFINTSMAF